MKKYLLLGLIFSTTFIYAQNVNEEEIELPEVTTVVSGSSIKAGKDSIPDYSKIVPDENTVGIELPKMDSNDVGDAQSNLTVSQGDAQKNVYAEGRLGGGYPFYFIGDFSVYRTTGSSPFQINFKHESTEGFADKKASNGFFTRDTSINAEKSKISESAKHNASFFYKSSDDGLQSFSSIINDQVKHTLGANFSSDWKFKNGLIFGYGANGNWYKRYSGLNKDGTVNKEDIVQSETSIFYIEPNIALKWQNDSFKIGFDIDYSSQLNLGEDDSLVKAQGSSSAESTHRGQMKLDFQWEIPVVTLWANVGGVFGNAIGEESIIVPFSLGSNWKIKAFTSERFLAINVEGGLKSYQETVQSLENQFKYSVCFALPVETTDWYCKAQIGIPLKDVLTLGGGIDFYKTSFDNGVWQPNYLGAKTADYELYAMDVGEHKEINSNVFANFSWNNFNFGGSWVAFWEDVPSLNDKHNLYATAIYRGNDAKWSSICSARFGFGSGADKVPQLNLNASVKASSSIQLALEVNDIVKLFTAKTRSYASSDYAQKSGNIALVAKFQF